MEYREPNHLESPGALRRGWQRLPVAVRAILAGLVVFQVLQNGWYSAFFLNLEYAPGVPWSVPVGALLLWVGFQYFGGRWWPRTTSQARKVSLRARWLTREQWKWALPASALIVVLLASFVSVFYRLMDVTEESYDLSMLPWWSLFPSLVMVSVVAGVSEEAGFRGYMQGPLERRYGPVVAISVNASIFWLMHLNHETGVQSVWVLLVMGLALGGLAWCAQSIWPGILAHAAADALSFLSEVGELAPGLFFRTTPLAQTGIDTHFVVSSVLLLVSLLGGVYVLRRLRAVTSSTAQVPPDSQSL